MKKITFCFLAIYLLLFSCDKVTIIKAPSFIWQYNDFKNITAEQLDGSTIVIRTSSILKEYRIDDKGEEKIIFDSLCVKHNDLTYNRKISYIMFLPNQYLVCDFTSINLTSDADFDDLHPSGSSLNDIFRFMSESPYRYILNGYRYDEEEAKKVSDTFKDYFGDYWFDNAKKDCIYPIEKMACDIRPEDMILLGYNTYNYPFGHFICLLKAESNPTISKQHNLTITLTADNGKTYSTTLFAEFE